MVKFGVESGWEEMVLSLQVGIDTRFLVNIFIWDSYGYSLRHLSEDMVSLRHRSMHRRLSKYYSDQKNIGDNLDVQQDISK